jgi:hypothetical protein
MTARLDQVVTGGERQTNGAREKPPADEPRPSQARTRIARHGPDDSGDELEVPAFIPRR